MSRYRGPRLRITRKLGDLPGLTKKSPKDSKKRTPGQHGIDPEKKEKQMERKRNQYGIRLWEKQKVCYNYGITENQLLGYVREARKIKGSTGKVFLELLEMRVDNIVFRLGLTPTIVAARQLVNHGHILINNKKVTIPSYQCKPKDVITLSKKKQSQNVITEFVNSQNVAKTPPHLSFEKENLTGNVKGIITRKWVGLQLKELRVIEYCSRKL